MRRLLLACVCASLLAGSAAAQSNFRLTLREDTDTLDPTLSRTFVGRIIFAGLCDKLFDISPKLEIVPQLALSYAWTDPKTLTIKLRPGVLFHDGEALDAAAVKYSLERHLTLPGSFRRSEISAMDHVEVVDPLTVRIVLKAPSAPFVAQLADRAGMILAPKAAEAAGKDFGLKPVCAGPFRFVERNPQDHVTLERFPQYWDAGRIHLDRVTYQVIPDSSVRLDNLQAGATDFVEYILPTDVETVRKNPKLRLSIEDALSYQTIEFNVGNGPNAKSPIGTDPRIRRALELSIDRAAVSQVVYDGLYDPTAQAISPASPMYVPALKPQPRDVEAAKALLQQAGVRPPLTVQMNVPNSPDIRQVAEILQSMAAEAGFDLRLNTLEFASSLEAATRGDFTTYLVAWSGRVDPDGNLYSFLHTGAPLNDGHYSNPDVDKELDAARAVADTGQRRDAYARMYGQEAKDLALIYLWRMKNIAGMSTRVQGYVPVPDGIVRLQGVSLAP